MKNLFLLGLFAVLCNPVVAQTLTFDDQNFQSAQIYNGYGGMNWTNFFLTSGSTSGPITSGYDNAVVSPTKVAVNGSGEPASMIGLAPFTLNSFYMTAAWNDQLLVHVTGYREGISIYAMSFSVNTDAPKLIMLDWANIDQVNFSSEGGIPKLDWFDYGNGTNFAMDNLTINMPVPEPIVWQMMVSGLGLVGIAVRRRKRIA